MMAMYYECPTCLFSDVFVRVGDFKVPAPVCEYGCPMDLVLRECVTITGPRKRFIEFCGFVRDTQWGDETPLAGRS